MNKKLKKKLSNLANLMLEEEMSCKLGQFVHLFDYNPELWSPHPLEQLIHIHNEKVEVTNGVFTFNLPIHDEN